jgi:hypothetical protein
MTARGDFSTGATGFCQDLIHPAGCGPGTHIVVNDFQENLADTPARDVLERHLDGLRQQGGVFTPSAFDDAVRAMPGRRF